MSVFLRVALALSASLAVALSMIVTLNLLKFDASLRQLAIEHSAIVLSSTSHAATAAYDLGLPLSAFSALDEVRQRTGEEEQDLEDILLYDHQGIVLAAGNRQLIGMELPSSWRPQRPENGIWAVRADGKLLVGQTLHSSFGIKVGGLIVVRSEEAHATALQAAITAWPLKAAGILLVSCLIAMPATWLLSARIRRLVLHLTGEGPAGSASVSLPPTPPAATSARAGYRVQTLP